MSNKIINIAIFASGSGSNTEQIIDYFHNTNINVKFVLTNNQNAPVIQKTQSKNIKVITCNNIQVEQPNFINNICQINNIQYIILAGFLRKIPTDLIKQYPNKIINIHPSLLPKYGGKGMYGMNIHNTVKNNGDNESGITIHFVSENFDEGQRIAQFYTNINNSDTPSDIQNKIHQLEKTYFPLIIQNIINGKI